MITEKQAAILKWMCNEELVTWNRLYTKFFHGWEALETWNLIQEISDPDETRLRYIITPAGYAALTEFDSAPEVTRVTSDDILPHRKDAETLVIEYEAVITELEAENAALRAQIDTLRAYIPAQDTALDNVIPEAITMFKAYEALTQGRDELMAVLPECPEHGACIPYAKGWIERARGFEALLREALDAIAPVVRGGNDPDLQNIRGEGYLFCETNIHTEYKVFVEASDNEYLKIKHLRAIAEFAAKLRTALGGNE